MAAPTDPTALTLVNEALLLAGYDSPTTAQKERARDYWLQRVLNDIWTRAVAGGNTRLKTLQKTSIYIATIGRRRIAVPSDFSEELTLNVLDGTHTDTAQSGGTKQITLAADEDITDDDAEGAYCLITAGTGIREYKEIVDYNEDTLVATTAFDWATEPDSTSTYLIVDKHYPVYEQHQNDLDETTNPTVTGRPDRFSKYGDEIYFNRPFDGTYGVRMRYYANINKIDTSEGSTTLFTKILRNWQEALTAGVFKYALKHQKEWESYAIAEKEYNQAVINLLNKEMPFGGEFEGFYR